MNPQDQGKNPADTTPKPPTPGNNDPTPKDSKSQIPPDVQERITNFNVKAEAFRSKNEEASALLAESQQIVRDVGVALAKQQAEFSQKEDNFKVEAKSLQEQIETLKTQGEEKDKKLEVLEKENRELHENTIKELEEQIAAKKTDIEVLEKKLEAANKARKGGFGKGAAAATMVAVLVFGLWWFLGRPSSPLNQTASTPSDGDILVGGEGRKNTLAQGLSEKDMMTALFHKKYPDARIVKFLASNKLLFCKSVDKGLLSGFELKQADYKNGEFDEVLIPREDLYEDNRQHQPPCYNSEL